MEGSQLPGHQAAAAHERRSVALAEAAVIRRPSDEWVGLLVLAIPGMPLDSAVTILPLIPIGLGLGMLFVPTSRAALNATPLASHGRTSALLPAP